MSYYSGGRKSLLDMGTREVALGWKAPRKLTRAFFHLVFAPKVNRSVTMWSAKMEKLEDSFRRQADSSGPPNDVGLYGINGSGYAS
jgi:hypothetical protein